MIPSYSSTEEFGNNKLDDMIFSKEISSGFSDDISGEEEVLLVPDCALIAEAAPDLTYTLPRAAMPPIYHYRGGGQINLDKLDINTNQIDSRPDSDRNPQNKQIEFDEIFETKEQLTEGSPDNKDLDFRTLPLPNIQYSDVRRPSQQTVITVKNDTVTELIKNRANGERAYGETDWGNDAKNLQPFESQFGYEKEYEWEREKKQRRHLTLPSKAISSERKYGSLKSSNISDFESKENPMFIYGDLPFRRNSYNSNVNRTTDEDISTDFGRYSLPRRTLSEGSLLSDHETVSNISLLMIL